MLGTPKLHKLLKRMSDLESELSAELNKLNNESPMRWDPRWYEARKDIQHGILVLNRLYGARH